ncbi:hypothetical protein ACFL0P_01805 [Candidatus Omnitrophota bacterium]
MKKLLCLIAIAFLLGFVFFESNTWETQKVSERRDGFMFTRVRHRLCWDRFFDYIKNTPKRVLESDIVTSLLSKIGE